MMLPATEFVINARFLTRPATGVDRVAIELTCALAARPDVAKLTLLHPKSDRLHRDWIDTLPPDIAAKIAIKQIGHWRGYFWEQLDLSRAMPKQTLLSLCNTGPAFRRNQAVMIHDAQVWDVPQSYSWPFRLAYRILLPLVARRARHVLTVSEFSARRLTKLGVVPQGKAVVLLNGVDHVLRRPSNPDTLARHGLTPNSYFFAIGNLAPHKNLALLVAAANARTPNAPELIIAGGLNSKVFADAGLSRTKRVRFIGRVSDEELRALYEGAIALAFPSLTEGFGLPPLEAMLCGCPVIATTGGALPEICGDAALFVDPTDQAGWTTALERMAKDTGLREELTRKGLQVSGRYTWAGAVKNLMGTMG